MLNEWFGLNDCEVRSDFWGGAVKRELGNDRYGMLLEFCPNAYLKC